MLIQVNTDNNIEGKENLVAFVKEELENDLGRFEEYITRIEVHLSDQNSHKETPDDKKCVLEVRPKGLQPIVVTDTADNIHQAIAGATDKMIKTLGRTFEKMRS